ncbi:DEAD/DEAH box helicase [Planococcus lenghuensis]|uniref:DEAD/DEAH box helicase n=1 Tax=Planococcus lenghuensis TaxID=2213202 RepID=UPI0018DE7914|nr:DEAD/DEAH box helicase [Planococcus lenghuensis]
MEVKGASPAITDHLNGQGRKLPVSSEGKRTRFAESQQVKSDLKELRKHPVLHDEEIPQFFDNPKSLFPDHEFSFDIESFSERVKGFITIARPRSVFRNGKTEWFDSESGEPVPFDEEELKKEIEKDPKRSFYRLASTYIYAGNGLKADLGFGKEEKESDSTRVTLDIYDNERALEYDVKAKGRGFESFPIPKTLQANLYDYQKEGFDWLCSLEKSGSAGLLADDMGLGKTMQVIAFLLHQREQDKLVPSLIVLPIALIENWKNEIEKFAPVLKDSIYIHQGSQRIKDVAFLENQPLTFISYDTLKVDQLIFGQVTYQNIIADEAQNIKSHLSSRSRALRAMKGNFRLAMTGTPVENGLEELWTIMDFVAPGEMFSLAEFKAQFVKQTNHELLMTKLKDFYLRRTKQEVLADRLPQKHLLAPVYLNASAKQKHLAGTVRSSMSGGQASALNALMHLRQLYAHPAVVTDEEPLVRDSPKLVELMALLGRVQKQQEKVLVFTEFRKVHSILKTEITKKYGIHVPVIDGTTANRSEVVRQFNEKSGFAVMLLSPKAAGVGLTITSANHVIHFTRWWNPAVENQATDRAYRIGQTKDVYVYQLITKDAENFPKGTVEELMHELLSEKSALAENVIVPFDTASFQRQVLEKMKSV